MSIPTRSPSFDPDLGGAVLDRYRLIRRIGMGGMGAVYEAEHITLDRRFAVKVLRHELATQQDARRRFCREAKSAARVHHPNVVEISDYGETVDGHAFFVMELLRGRNLQQLLDTEGRLDWSRTRDIMLQVASALGSVHQEGIIHRDMKPSNCFLLEGEDDAPRDVIKILDFGIAKLMEHREQDFEKITTTAAIIGTCAYMAPEMASLHHCSELSDVYATGIMMYRMLVGAVPFKGETVFEILSQHIDAPPPPPRATVPSIPEGVEAIILKALEKEPHRRFLSMAALAAALREGAPQEDLGAIEAAASGEQDTKPDVPMPVMGGQPGDGKSPSAVRPIDNISVLTPATPALAGPARVDPGEEIQPSASGMRRTTVSPRSFATTEQPTPLPVSSQHEHTPADGALVQAPLASSAATYGVTWLTTAISIAVLSMIILAWKTQQPANDSEPLEPVTVNGEGISVDLHSRTDEPVEPRDPSRSGGPKDGRSGGPEDGGPGGPEDGGSGGPEDEGPGRPEAGRSGGPEAGRSGGPEAERSAGPKAGGSGRPKYTGRPKYKGSRATKNEGSDGTARSLSTEPEPELDDQGEGEPEPDELPPASATIDSVLARVEKRIKRECKNMGTTSVRVVGLISQAGKAMGVTPTPYEGAGSCVLKILNEARFPAQPKITYMPIFTVDFRSPP